MIKSLAKRGFKRASCLLFGCLGLVVTLLVGLWFVFFGGGDPAPLPEAPEENQFGFLTGGPFLQQTVEFRNLRETGAAWARPHPGPFSWDKMQRSATSEIDFSDTDRLVKAAGQEGVSLLITLWPYVEWDEGASAADCTVEEGDPFSRDIGVYRCNPTDWDAYRAWVMAVVERYDGDGIDDMKDLRVPVKHWEVMNEPDLAEPTPPEPPIRAGTPGPGESSADAPVPPPPTPPEPEEGSLKFYLGTANDYAELLVRTNSAIKAADSSAKTVIAGAAGGTDTFLDFYRDVFANEEARNAFDIGNVHCISNDYVSSFNAEPYRELLNEFGLEERPFWVTEAEAFVSTDAAVTATAVRRATQGALDAGAERIFYTTPNFEQPAGGNKVPPLSPVDRTFAGLVADDDLSGAETQPDEIYSLIIAGFLN